MKPHKHAEVIKAWADGAQIQAYDNHLHIWVDLFLTPTWTSEKYRIKPEPKPDYVYYGVFDMDGSIKIGSCFTKLNHKSDQIKITFDGETGKLKSAEVL